MAFIDIESGMMIVIVDDVPGEPLIGTAVFNDPIPANSFAQSEQLDLSDQTISNRWRLDYTIPIGGTDSSIIIGQEELDSHIYTEVHVSKMNVTRAVAKVL